MFVVFYSGEKAKNKILKICEAFGANKYPFSEDFVRQAQMITEVCIPKTSTTRMEFFLSIQLLLSVET